MGQDFMRAHRSPILEQDIEFVKNSETRVRNQR